MEFPGYARALTSKNVGTKLKYDMIWTRLRPHTNSKVSDRKCVIRSVEEDATIRTD